MGLDTVEHHVDVCVIGGGLAGLCAAVAAARRGARALLMHERPMLGGNASSEIRMWVCGARGAGNRETGILEELMMENLYRNPDRNYSIWDGILQEKALEEKNLTLLLNCSCMDASADSGSIRYAVGWQMTTQLFHKVHASVFVDCSGDSILAPLTGAAFRVGREGREEHRERIAPAFPDSKTMGLTCTLQAREEETDNVFIPPAFTRPLGEEDLRFRTPDMEDLTENFWYLELGGDRDSIRDTELLRDELQALAYGLWDHIKNAPGNRERNGRWHLDFVGALPGKRESRRYTGAYVMTEGDVLSGGAFEDEVAYGGWTMDDHDPAGFWTKGPPNTHHPAPSPFGIPLRCLYSRNVSNLLFAGRNISVTHAALSSTRVMGTCAILGQAAGTAAALCARHGCLPADVSSAHIRELQAMLQFDDCFLPHIRRRLSSLMNGTRVSASVGDPGMLTDGMDRPRAGCDHAWHARPGSSVTLEFPQEERIRGIRVIFDSDLDRSIVGKDGHPLRVNLLCNRPAGIPPAAVPEGMVRAFTVTADSSQGRRLLAAEHDNHHRRYLARVDTVIRSVTLRILSSWGAEEALVFGFEVF